MGRLRVRSCPWAHDDRDAPCALPPRSDDGQDGASALIDDVGDVRDRRRPVRCGSTSHRTRSTPEGRERAGESRVPSLVRGQPRARHRPADRRGGRCTRAADAGRARRTRPRTRNSGSRCSRRPRSGRPTSCVSRRRVSASRSRRPGPATRGTRSPARAGCGTPASAITPMRGSTTNSRSSRTRCDYVAANTPRDRETAYLEAIVTYWRNGRDPETVVFRSEPRVEAS